MSNRILEQVAPPFAGFFLREQVIFVQDASVGENFSEGYYFRVLHYITFTIILSLLACLIKDSRSFT